MRAARPAGPDFEAAASRLAGMGWPVLVRRSGGGAFPIGPGTVQIAMIARYPDRGISMDGVYDRLGFLIGSALAEFGIAARVGDTRGAFCDGRHDLVVADRKIAGLAQHWRPCGGGERCVTAAASVLVDADVGELGGIVDWFHAICGQAIDIRPEAMTTVVTAAMRLRCHTAIRRRNSCCILRLRLPEWGSPRTLHVRRCLQQMAFRAIMPVSVRLSTKLVRSGNDFPTCGTHCSKATPSLTASRASATTARQVRST